MFERFLYILTYWLFAIVLWMALTPAKANDLLIYYSSNESSQYSNLKSHFEDLGFTVTGSTSGTVSSSAVSGKELVIDIVGNSNCGSTCRSVYDSYVSGGGKLIIAVENGASNRQNNIESLIENKMSVGSMTYYSSWSNDGYTSRAEGDYASSTASENLLPYTDTVISATGGTAMAKQYSSSWATWYKWDYGSNGGSVMVTTGYGQFLSTNAYAGNMETFLTTAMEEEGLYSSTPTYSSAPTSAQLQSRTDSRSISSNGNAVYITQSGDNLDLDIVQYDNDNLVAGTSTTSSTIANATITGDDNTVNITQGNNVGSFSDDNVTLLDISGTNNTLTVRQGDNVDDVGGHRSSTNIVGNYNTLGILQQNDGGVGSNGHFMEIDVAGNSNVMYMDQKDDGDKMLFMDINGSSNDVDIIQQGTGEHFLDVTAGSNQTIDVLQDGSGSHAATINMSGYTSTLDLDQSGSTDKTYSLNQICTNANGCGTTTITQN